MSTFADLSLDEQRELWAVLALRHAKGIGPCRARRLAEHFGSAFAAAEAGMSRPTAWAECGVTTKQTATAFALGHWRENAKGEWCALRKSGVSFIMWSDARYPSLLREINDAPLLLYYKGDLALLGGPALAVVGARQCTPEGIAVSAWFSRALSLAGVAVISGMAMGIDRAAHLAGLRGPGRSIAVLGTGIDVVYPGCNADLYALLRQNGLIISEYGPGVGPAARHFPIRNRIISGLSSGVLVVEAAGRSGSLITARLALEQNRDVFAVPGHTMAAVSEGCRELIRRGARPVFDADDILEDLAPLLELEARRALEKRRALGKADDKAAAARAAAQKEAASELAQILECEAADGLPWMASEKTRPGKSGEPLAGVGNLVTDADVTPADDLVTTVDLLPVSGVAEADVQEAEPVTTPVKKRNAPGKGSVPLNDEESGVLGALGGCSLHIDDLARHLGMDVSKLSGLLTMLEVRGLVRRSPGMIYSLPEV